MTFSQPIFAPMSTARPSARAVAGREWTRAASGMLPDPHTVDPAREASP